MDPHESQLSFLDPAALERLKKALHLPLGPISTCQATTKTSEKCETEILFREKIDPILASLLLEPLSNSPPAGLVQLLTKLSHTLLFLCPQFWQHTRPFEIKIPVDTLNYRFFMWKLSEKNRDMDDEKSREESGQHEEDETSTPSQGLQRVETSETILDEDNDDTSHSEYQPSEHSDEDSNDEDETEGALDDETVEEPEDKTQQYLDEQSRSDTGRTSPATNEQTLSTPPRTITYSAHYESDTEDENSPISEASTPIPIVFSPPEEPSLVETPDTDIITSRNGRRYSASYLESPTKNRGSSAQPAEEGSTYFDLAGSDQLRPNTPELYDEERPRTASNSRRQQPFGKKLTRKSRSVSAQRGTEKTPLCASITLPDGTRTADIYGIESKSKSNPLKEVLTFMRGIVYGDNLSPGHVYAYKDKSVPGHIKIGYSKEEQGTSKESHIVLKPVAGDKNLHLWKRLKAQEDQCMSDMEVLFAVYMPCAAGQIERLVHRTLFEEKRIAKCKKQGCFKGHIEWFDVDETRALEVIMRWAEFSQLFPYNRKGCLGNIWDDHAYEYLDGSRPMTLQDWWNGPWNDFRLAQKATHVQQLASALEEEKKKHHSAEMSLLDEQIDLQLEINKLQQDKMELQQCAARLREEKVRRGLEQERQRQKELQQQLDALSLR